MREILFKAKRKNWKELPKEEWWVKGYFVFCRKHYYILPELNQNTGYDERCDDWVEIDPDTICQYTGLTDKNGQKIWENDVLRGHGNEKDLSKAVFGEVYVIDVETIEIVDSVVGWHTEVIETDEISKCEPFNLPMPLTEFYINRSEYEVIGNIFDDPELVGGAE